MQASNFDLAWELRTNPALGAQVQALVARIAWQERQAERQPSVKPQLAESIKQLLKLCNYNFGLLTGYFFPTYLKGGPLSLARRPYAYAMFNLQVGGSTTIRGSRQIAKSTTFSSRQLMLTHALPGYGSIYIAPHPKQVKTYADRLKEMERFNRFYQETRGYRQNLYFKEYPGGSKIKLIHVLGDATAARGNSSDEILFDEFQNFDLTLLTEVLEIQRASDMKVRLYAGTSTTTDSALETVFSQSSQGMWHLKCGCGEWLNCGDREQALAMVQPEGVCCPKCSRLQDVTQGRWVHADREALAALRPGYHIPQIIIPDFTLDAVQWDEIYQQKVRGGNLNKFLEECLGIPTEEGARELTKKQLQEICILDYKTVREKAKRGEYMMIISGFDWGGSDYVPEARTKESYTVHTMLGVNHDRTIDILHFKHYAGMDYHSIANCFILDHGELRGEALASDHGGGQLYNSLLREAVQNIHKHFIFDYVGPAQPPIDEPRGFHLFNQWSLNRTESITALYQAIKAKRIRCFQWALAEPYLMQFLNLVRTPQEKASGSTTFTYRRHGSKPDDPLHAVNFAYTLARLLLGESLCTDRLMLDRILANLRGGAPAHMVPGKTLGRRLGAISG